MSRFDSATSAAVAFGAGILLVGTLAGCSQIDDLLSQEHREQFPTYAEDWSTQEWPDEIRLCGDYEVMPMDDGWLGWFQAREPGETPG